MGRPVIREVRPGDAAYIAKHLCAADRRAFIVLHGKRKVYDIVTEALLLSERTRAFALPDHPLAIFGVCPVSEGIGNPWLLCTEETFKHPRAMLVEGRRFVREIRKAFPVLLGYVDQRNEALTKWLSMLGFTFGAVERMGKHEVPFHMFKMGVSEDVRPDTSW